VDVIPHGVDTRCFRPLPGGRAAARAALGLDLADDQAFIVLNANRNLAKKRLDLSLEGFAQFVAQAEGEVRLLLHTDPAGQGSYHLPTLVRRLGLGDQLILSPMAGRTEDALDNERLNVLYNACDVGLNTSVNEGFGLVAFEHAATGAAQVLPSTPVLKDLWQQAAVLLDSDRPAVNPGLLTLNYPVTAGAVANALARLHRDLPWRQHMSEAGRMHANLPGFAWPAILLQWRKLFSEVLARPA
jgi:glycosyltransferase involved in cell wall biosynthesis